MNIAQHTIIAGVQVYQKILSPDHSLWAQTLNRPPYCKHTPSCSDYMIQAVTKNGAIIGLSQGVARIARCNPWSKGGYDPVK